MKSFIGTRSGPLPRAALLVCALLLAACSRTPILGDRHDKEDIKAVAARAESTYAAEDWPAAAEAYGKLVEAMPQDANLWFRYANALARADQPDRAVAAYREVLVRDARFSKAWFNMGIVQLRQAAGSFSRMEGNIAADDPLRAQSRQVHEALMAILGSGGQEARSGISSATATVGAPDEVDDAQAK